MATSELDFGAVLAVGVGIQSRQRSDADPFV